MVRRHQGNPGRGAELSDDRRYRLQGLKTVRHAAGLYLRRRRHPYRRRQPDRPQRLRHRAGQKDKTGDGLSDDDRTQFPGDPALDRLAADDREASRRDAGRLETGRRRHHRGFGLRRRGQDHLSAGLEIAKTLYPDRAAAEVAAWRRHCEEPTGRNDELRLSARLSQWRPLYTSANPAIVTASTTLGDAMDDDKPILEQMTDAVSTAATATADAAKTVVKKVKKAAKKVAKKVTPKKARKAKKASKASRKSAAAHAAVPDIATASSRSPNST